MALISALAERVVMICALAGVALVAVGVGLVSVPAALIIGGIELMGVAYVVTYLRAMRAARGE